MRLRVASYNIRKSVGLDWRRDPARTIRVINRLGADVVALQEADKRLGPRHAALDPDLIARETDLEVLPLALSPVSIGWHGNALLARKGLRIAATGHIELPGIEPRGSVMARLALDGEEITVVGVHLGLRRGCRRLQFARLLDLLGAEAARTVIMGDFNEWSSDRGIEALRPEFRVVSPGRSFHAARPVACLDRFALGTAVELLAAGVGNGPDARIASDHLPVWAELRVGAKRPASAGASAPSGRHSHAPAMGASQAATAPQPGDV